MTLYIRLLLVSLNVKWWAYATHEIRHFLSTEPINQIVEKDNLWAFITYLIEDLESQMKKFQVPASGPKDDVPL